MEAVAEDWHARFAATGRSYLYRLLSGGAGSSLMDHGRAWHVGQQALDVTAMQVRGKEEGHRQRGGLSRHPSSRLWCVWLSFVGGGCVPAWPPRLLHLPSQGLPGQVPPTITHRSLPACLPASVPVLDSDVLRAGWLCVAPPCIHE